MLCARFRTYKACIVVQGELDVLGQVRAKR